MKLSDLGVATSLRNRRTATKVLRIAAQTGLFDCSIRYDGDRYDIAAVMSFESLRRAISTECDRLIQDCDDKLSALGVEVDEPPVAKAA